MFESRPPHKFKKKIKMKNQILQNLIVELKKASIENNASIWKKVSNYLEVYKKSEVNLDKINNYCKEGEIVLVPGKVLGMGELNKKITIAAYGFSGSALMKIHESGSKAITIQELMKKNPKGSKVRIIR